MFLSQPQTIVFMVSPDLSCLVNPPTYILLSILVSIVNVISILYSRPVFSDWKVSFILAYSYLQHASHSQGLHVAYQNP